MSGGENEKAPEGADSPAPARSSGEGSDTALQALIRKRKLRAEDDEPSRALGDGADGDASPA